MKERWKNDERTTKEVQSSNWNVAYCGKITVISLFHRSSYCFPFSTLFFSFFSFSSASFSSLFSFFPSFNFWFFILNPTAFEHGGKLLNRFIGGYSLQRASDAFPPGRHLLLLLVLLLCCSISWWNSLTKRLAEKEPRVDHLAAAISMNSLLPPHRA